MWRIIATWPFGLPGVREGAQVLARAGCALDAVEAAVRVVETGGLANSVGLNGKPNSAGVVELDAAIMDGRTLQLGAVAAVRGIRHPVSIARRVMSETSHALLVGAGAEAFAAAQGFTPEEPDHEALAGALHPDSDDDHDTVCVIAIDADGDIAVATSTSGLAGKLPGRTGDTPLVGCGFYADNLVGAVAATGVGEWIMRGCLSWQALAGIDRGATPDAACAEAIRAFQSRCHQAGQDPPANISLIALDRHGRWGAGSNRPEFTYAVASESLAPQLQTITGL